MACSRAGPGPHDIYSDKAGQGSDAAFLPRPTSAFERISVEENRKQLAFKPFIVVQSQGRGLG